MYTITNKGRKITNSKIKINHASFDKPEKIKLIQIKFLKD